MSDHLVRVRVSGPPEAVAQVADELRRRLAVAEESGDYANRRDPGVRRYLSVLVAPSSARVTPHALTLARRIDTADDVRAFLAGCVRAFGQGFHPDTLGAEYHDVTSGAPVFTVAQATAFDALMDRARHVLDVAGEDIYALTLALPEWSRLSDG
jgi:hypothetical protein